MTSIDKIEISGVRSFDPNPRNKQTVVFHKPLTVILGKNGAGKTTIIESLLYACTGEMPPGSAGPEKCSFVYDPKAAREVEVKAQIRLTVTAIGGTPMLVIRSFQAQTAKTKTSFTTLDSTIAYNDQDGSAVTRSFRAGDCDKRVPELLGVSKAILEHVIFCHQEDSNWPLGTPAELKKKFDEIFAATRYVAALDNLRDIRNNYKKELKEFEGSMIELREHKEQATRYQSDIAAKKDSIRDHGLRVKEIEPKLILVNKAIDALDSISSNIEATSRTISAIHGKIEEKNASIQHLQKNRRPTQTLEELRDIRKNFDDHILALRKDMQTNEQIKRAKQEARQGRQVEMYQLRAEYDALLRAEKEHKQRVASLQSLIQESLGKDEPSIGFVVGEGALDAGALERVEQFIKQSLGGAVKEGVSVSDEMTKRRAAMAERKDTLHRAMDGASQERNFKEEAASQARDTLQGLRAQLDKATIDVAATAKGMGIVANAPPINFVGPNGGTAQSYYIPAADAAVATLQRRVEAAAERRRQGASFQKEELLIKKSQALGVDMHHLRQQLASRESEQVYANRRQVLQGQLHQKQAALDVAKVDLVNEIVDHAYSNAAASALDAAVLNRVKTLRNGASVQEIASVVESIRAQRETALSRIILRQQDADRASTGVRQQLSHKKAELSDAERALQQKQAVLNSIGAIRGQSLNPDNFAQILALTEADYMECSRAANSLEALAQCYESFVRTAKEKNMCAVCERNISDSDMFEFVNLNNRRQATNPEEIKLLQKKAESTKLILDDLRGAAPIIADIRRLTHDVIPRLSSEIARLSQDLAAHETALGELQEQCNATRADASAVRDAILVQFHKLQSQDADRANLVSELSAVEAHLQNASGHGSESLDSLQARLEKATAESDALALELNDLRRENASHAEDGDQGSLDKELATAKELRFKLGSQVEAGVRCAVEVAKLEEDLRALAERIAFLKSRRQELQGELDTLNASLEKLDSDFSTRKAQCAKAVERWERISSAVSSAAIEVKKYISSNREQHLRNVQGALPQLESADQRDAEAIKALEDKIAESRKVLDDQGRMIAGIESSIQLLETVQAIAVLEKQQRAQEEALTALKADKLKDVASTMGNDYNPSLSHTKLREILQQRHVELERTRSKWLGAMDSVEKDVSRLEACLADDKYKSIERRFLGMLIKVQTTEIVIQDLEKFLKALEKAVQSYHLEKIQHINQLIAEFWRQTYRGSDIDTIEIRSEDETPAGSATASGRSYKYRVVMKRGTSELEMRGRCSAGQKVLASVVIRLALSEAFCCDCGVLALDEPTTNLDEDNARSLARALKELIDSRRAVKHFQLIIITHDEQFVRELGASSVDRFYFVRKDRVGAFSLIEDKAYSDLF